MEESLEKEMNLLLSNFWITRDNDKENYYLLKRNQDKIKNFLSRTCGNKLIVHDRFIKLEKIPGFASKSGGINSFSNQEEYVMLILLLLFLEDKTRGEKFILSSLIDYIRNTAITLELIHIPDWLNANTRRSLVNVIDYLLEREIILLRDTDNKSFIDTEDADALYESTGLSNYLLLSFDFSIFDLENPDDFLKQEWVNLDEEKGNVRRYKVYRNLFYYPLIVRNDISVSEEDYLKKMHKVIENEFSSKLNMNVEITKNMYMVYASESVNEKEYFPNSKNISDLVLIINKRILDFKDENDILINDNECFILTNSQFESILKLTREEDKKYFSKRIIDMKFSKYKEEIINFMSDYNLIKEINEGILITPGVGRFIGRVDSKDKVSNEQLVMEVI